MNDVFSFPEIFIFVSVFPVKDHIIVRYIMIFMTLFLLFLILPVHAQNGISMTFTVTTGGYEFQAHDDIQLLSIKFLLTRSSCVAACHQHQQCHTFDYDKSTRRCRLFQGDQTTGSDMLSTSNDSFVGSLVIPYSASSSIFNQSCSVCVDNRYFMCSDVSNTCQCSPDMYWDGNLCRLQLFEGSLCNQTDACRSNLGIFCVNLPNKRVSQCSTGEYICTTHEYQSANKIFLTI